MLRGEIFPNVKPGDAVRAEHLNAIVKGVRARTPTSSPTVKVVETATGFYMESRAAGRPGSGSGGCDYSWTPSFAGNDGVGNDHVQLNVGSVSGATVTITDAETLVATSILAVPSPKLAIPDSGLYIAYVEITGTKTKTANDFVTGFTISSATIKVSDGVPASSQSVRRLELFRWYNGTLYSQLTRYNLLLYCRDDGTSTDVGVFSFLPAA